MTNAPEILTMLAAETLRAEFSEETYYDRQTYPSVNVKCSVYCDTIPWDDLAGEFDADHVAVVRSWAAAVEQSQTYPTPIDSAIEIAQESAWEDAKELAREHFGDGARVYSAGRSGGHLIVHGIGEPDSWTDELCSADHGSDWCTYACEAPGYDAPNISDVRAWAEFRRDVLDILAGYPYDVGWHLVANVHDPIHDLAGVL